MTKKAVAQRIRKILNKPGWTRLEILELLDTVDVETEIEFKELLFLAARSTDSTIKGLLSNSRNHKYTTGRALIYHYMRNKGYTATFIGKQFNKDHVTVLHGVKTLMNGVEYNHPQSVEAFNKFKKLTA